MRGIAKSRAGMTLLEILIVVAIMALLVMISLPAIGKAMKSTRHTVCAGYQYQVGRSGACGDARLRLEAFHLGCYNDPKKEFPVFEMPEGVSEEEFEKQLEADMQKACH